MNRASAGHRPVAHEATRVMIVRAFSRCSMTRGTLLPVNLLAGASRTGGHQQGTSATMSHQNTVPTWRREQPKTDG